MGCGGYNGFAVFDKGAEVAEEVFEVEAAEGREEDGEWPGGWA